LLAFVKFSLKVIISICEDSLSRSYTDFSDADI